MSFILTVAALSFVIWSTLKVVTKLQVRRETTAELERIVFAVPADYLEFVGLHRASVVRFRELVERKDLASLYREWPTIERDFLAAEREAGHRGRPLIMDYMLDYRAYIRELMRRHR